MTYLISLNGLAFVTCNALLPLLEYGRHVVHLHTQTMSYILTHI